ncbi:MAG: hypothetical protein M0Q91_18440 [Methanoregula sp.]|nr:hypothetical protein [Methanoregula sp.]
MRCIVPCALFLVVGCVLASGCATQTKSGNDTVPLSPSQTFTRFTVPGTEGPLKISVGGLTGKFPVSVDRLSVGVVSAGSPITLTMPEGNYTVEVCCGKICEHENVSVRFGRQRTVDVSEQLKKDLGSSGPAVRMAGYFLSGNQLTVNVEFINPTTETLTMSADVACAYSYIEGRNYNRVGSLSQGRLVATVNACDRVTETQDFDFVSGSSYVYDVPVVTLVSSG